MTGAAFKARETADDGRIVGEAAVTVQLAEIREEQLDVVEGMGALRMPRQQNTVPSVLRCARTRVLHGFQLLPQAVDFLQRGFGLRRLLELGDLPLQLCHDCGLSV